LRNNPVASDDVGGTVVTGVRGSHVAVVGGSIAGTAMAIALAGSGCHVTVFERSSGELHARGFGIGIPVAVRDEFVAAGTLGFRPTSPGGPPR
jgi:NADPH-dependent 2,4-dienoyl-CoA reductase/sulfur reductase-like enzyme